jgi:hypothetical protein
MKTASWSTYTGPGRVGICIGSPRGQPAGYRFYRPLAPTRDMLKLPPSRYDPMYAVILAKLDPERVWDDLHKLATDRAGVEHEPILMCFEKPPFKYPDNLCHRRTVARWFRAELGRFVPEIGYDGPDGHR